MKAIVACLLILAFSSTAGAAGKVVSYQVSGEPYEGYYVSPSADAPLVLLIHDWDGLTDYEVKRADMLADMGYAVFAADLFGAGVRPTEVKDKRQHTGAPHAFTVFGGNRYREDADKKSWKRFTEYLSETLK
ncbi:Dienelactone hydrolase family protein [Olavius algarvensis associated proteobacterium Delta 3]|nr:Dienelactone hydrolase family protein [Olavius algarvensis associated proteobacterium Delta 3]